MIVDNYGYDSNIIIKFVDVIISVVIGLRMMACIGVHVT